MSTSSRLSALSLRVSDTLRACAESRDPAAVEPAMHEAFSALIAADPDCATVYRWDEAGASTVSGVRTYGPAKMWECVEAYAVLGATV